MGHIWIFLLGAMTGCFLGIFVLGLCQTAREDYFYGPTKTDDIDTSKTAKYILDNGGQDGLLEG